MASSNLTVLAKALELVHETSNGGPELDPATTIPLDDQTSFEHAVPPATPWDVFQLEGAGMTPTYQVS